MLGFMAAILPLKSQTVRVATINVWSGLDYKGTLRMGEYEPDSVRNRRIHHLVSALRASEPDIIALQECNPVDDVAALVASELGYDAIIQRANGGIKIGRIGIPWNLNEGLVLLAKKELRLKRIDVLDLSRTLGAFGNVISFHTSDQNIALVGSVLIDGHQILIINTHLTANIPFDSTTDNKLQELFEVRHIRDVVQKEIREQFEHRGAKRKEELQRLIDYYRTRWTNVPVLLLGDFNAPPSSPELRLMDRDFIDASSMFGQGTVITWDPSRNPNVEYSKRVSDSSDIEGVMSSWYDGIPKRIDYVFLNHAFDSTAVKHVRSFASTSEDGVFISDHFGVLSDIDLTGAFAGDSVQETTAIASPASKLEVLPILTYDTDVGFGYGGKAFFLNVLGSSESFDAVVFNSTKGERWYRLVFSVPDFELRQGRSYPFSLDLIIDYDKYLKNNFFGIGRDAQASNRETYTKEPLDIQFVGSRGISGQIVTQLGVRFRTVRNDQIEAGGFFAATPSINQSRSQALTAFGSFRYDSRNSYVNPSSGNVFQIDVEAGSSEILSDYGLVSTTVSLQTYEVLFYPKTVLAARIVAKSVAGSNIPIHTYASLGGTGTLRGFPQDRFLDKATVLANVEVRFPIVWRFGGVVFYDAGILGPDLSRLVFLKGWKTNPGIGLRLIMDTFVVRADLGVSREGTGFYFNFGQLF